MYYSANAKIDRPKSAPVGQVSLVCVKSNVSPEIDLEMSHNMFSFKIRDKDKKTLNFSHTRLTKRAQYYYYTPGG